MCIDFLPDGDSWSSRRLTAGCCGASRTDLLSRTPTWRRVSTKLWNDIVVDGRGNAYVNSVGFDFPGGEFTPGIIVLVTPDGTVKPVADGLAFPNGMAVTADGPTLIVAEFYAEQLTAYQIAGDGTLDERRVCATTPGDHPDGICLDATGAA